MSVLGVLPFHHLLFSADSSICRLGSCLLSTRCSIPGISHGIVEPSSSSANVRLRSSTPTVDCVSAESRSSTPAVDCVTVGSRSSTPVVGCVIVVGGSTPTLVVDHAIVSLGYRQPSFQCHHHFLHLRCRCHCHFLHSVGGVVLYHSFSPFVSSSCGASQSV